MKPRTYIPLPDEWFNSVRKNWSAALQEKGFALRYGGSFLICFVAYMGLTRVLIHNATRDGCLLADPLQAHLLPVDLSVPIFIGIYSSIFLFLYYLIPLPKITIPAFYAFLGLFALRVLLILLLPLAPPAKMIALNDPFVDHVIGFGGAVRNDLFYSGHVADLSFFIFCCRHQRIRLLLIVITVMVSVMLVWQHVHYTADVLVAPFFAYACYSVGVKPRETAMRAVYFEEA